MKPFTQHTGLAVAMDRANVDTDQIIPKQFLKRIERSGFGEFLFWDWAKQDDGTPNPDFELNQPGAKGASILITRRNFGCGSSREHAPWALEDFGFRVLVAPTFADIFYNNCFKNSMLPIRLSEEQVDELFARAEKYAPYHLTADLKACKLTDEHGFVAEFEVRAVPPAVPARRPGRHRAYPRTRRQDRRLRARAWHGVVVAMRSMKVILPAALIFFAAIFSAAAGEVGDESPQLRVETVLPGLDQPCGLTIRPGVKQKGVVELLFAETGARRIVAVATNRPDAPREVVIGFPGDSSGDDSDYPTGPTGLAFLTRTKLVVAGRDSEQDDKLLRVYNLPSDGTALPAEEFDYAVRSARTGKLPSSLVGRFYGLAKTGEALFVVTHDDYAQGLILKSAVEANRLDELQTLVATSKLAEGSSPIGITVNPNPQLQYLVVGLKGIAAEPRDSRLCFYSPKSGALALSLPCGLHDIVDLAYSPSGDLYAVDCAADVEQDGGVYRLDEQVVDGKQTCHPVKIATVRHPTSLVFSDDGTLYVTAQGPGIDSAAADPEGKQGVLLKITGEF